MKRSLCILLSCAMTLCLGLAVVFARNGESAYAAETALPFVRTDSLTAQNADGTSKVADTTTATLIDRTAVGGTVKALDVSGDKAAVLDFDLPDDATEGVLRFMGDNLDTATIGIWTGASYYDWTIGNGLSLVGESKANGIIQATFSGAWLDADKKIVRVRVTGGTDAALFSAGVYSESMYTTIPVLEAGASLTVSHLSYAQLMQIIYVGGGKSGLETFLNDGKPVMRLNGPSIFNVRISANAGEISVDFAALADGNLRVRDASQNAGANGDPAAFNVIDKGAALDLRDYQAVQSGDENCYILQFIAWGGANAFMDSFTISTVAAPDKPVVSLRTDSTTASAEQANTVSVTGADVVLDAQEGTVPGATDYNNVLRFDEAAEEAVFEFDLPNTSAGGQLRLFGSNLDRLKLGIYNGGTDNGGYAILTDAAYLGDSKYGVMTAGFGDNTWYSSAQKIIRVRVWDASGEAKLNRITVLDGAAAPILAKDASVTVRHLAAEESIYAKYYGGTLKTYFNDKGVGALHLNEGMAIWELKVSAAANALNMTVETLTPTGFGVRDASENANADGTPAHYTPVQTGAQVKLSDYGLVDPDGTADSGDEYYLLHFIGYNSGDSIFNAFTAEAVFSNEDVTFDAMDNANPNVPAEGTSYFAVGTDAEKLHYFADATKGSDFAATFEAGNEGLVAGIANGGNFKTKNARQFTVKADDTAQSLIYEFRLPASTKQAVLKVFGTSKYEVVIHSENSVKRHTVLPESAPGTNAYGLLVYKLDETNAFTGTDGVIRVELVAAAKNQQLFGLSVQTGAAEELTGSVQISPFSEAAYRFADSVSTPNLYYLESDIPSWHLTSGSSVIYKVTVPAGQDTLLVAATASGAIGLEVSTDGTTFTGLFAINNNGGSITSTKSGSVDVSTNKTVWIKTAGGPGFLVYLNLSYPAEAGVNFAFDTFTAQEFEHISKLSEADPATPVSYGYVGLSHKSFSRTGRRIGFLAAAPGGASIVYAFDFNADEIYQKGGQNKLYLNMKAVFGTYNVWVSGDPTFASNVVTASGSAPRDVVLDASSVLTAVQADNDVKRVYVKVSHNNAQADTNMGGGLDFVFESLGMYADGSKGSGWPNDDDFDYGDAPDYDHNPGLPEIPEAPEGETGSIVIGGEGGASTGLIVGLSVGAGVLVLGGAAAWFIIYKKKGGKRV